MNSVSHDSPIVAQLAADLLQARKDRDQQKKEALESVLTRITNAEAVAVPSAGENTSTGMSIGVGSTEVQRRTLSGAEIHVLIQQEKDELEHALEGMRTYPDHPYAAELKHKSAILAQYL